MHHYTCVTVVVYIIKKIRSFFDGIRSLFYVILILTLIAWLNYFFIAYKAFNG